MSPFEDLIHELSKMMGIPLHVDNHQSCLISFLDVGVAVQIDLDTHADRILLGTQLGRLTPGIYRERLFMEAMRSNGTAKTLKGILAFSEKNDTLILFQFLNIAWVSGDKLYAFLQLFKEQAMLWKEALERGEIPPIVVEVEESKIR